MTDIKDRIVKVLEMKNVTPAELADRIGIARSGLSHILNDRNKPSLDLLVRIKTLYPDLSADWLFMGLGEPQADASPEGPQATKPKQQSMQMNLADVLSAPPGKPIIATHLHPRRDAPPQPAASPQAVESAPDQKAAIFQNSEATDTEPLNNEKYGPSVEQVIIFYNDGSFTSYRPR